MTHNDHPCHTVVLPASCRSHSPLESCPMDPCLPSTRHTHQQLRTRMHTWDNQRHHLHCQSQVAYSQHDLSRLPSSHLLLQPAFRLLILVFSPRDRSSWLLPCRSRSPLESCPMDPCLPSTRHSHQQPRTLWHTQGTQES